MEINKIQGVKLPEITKTKGFISGEDEMEKLDSNYKDFGQIFKNAFEALQETQDQSKEDSYRMAMGDFDNLHQMMINGEKAATALELTTQITSRAVSAYNEIMHMQI